MGETVRSRSRVERLLAEEWDVCRGQADRDGDYPWSHRTAVGWVGVVDGCDPFMMPVVTAESEDVA